MLPPFLNFSFYVKRNCQGGYFSDRARIYAGKVRDRTKPLLQLPKEYFCLKQTTKSVYLGIERNKVIEILQRDVAMQRCAHGVYSLNPLPPSVPVMG